MSLRKGFIVFLMALLLIGTIYPTSGYALSDQSDAIITTESNAENVDVSMEESALTDDEYLDIIDRDVYEEPEDETAVTDDTYGENSFSPQAMAMADGTLTMSPGDSYTFTNNGSATRSLSTNAATSRSSAYDYVIYRPDGSIMSET
ncbi:hypothetical protein [Paenibacillus sp. FSL H7-689]|uniref:hypothetical protein n=1 Tax=Paenibacillus sp. FSL H7-689 TaxID=1227349 RepID=UPI0003E2BBC4|nr:hypothetical protein [Paenibacillus sp. FSL H7-689]ETT44849.1 hypothetical protein C170_23145 [Paenibacillus sp. FSL H7-689]